jgi:hypothetical protein
MKVMIIVFGGAVTPLAGSLSESYFLRKLDL